MSNLEDNKEQENQQPLLQQQQQEEQDIQAEKSNFKNLEITQQKKEDKDEEDKISQFQSVLDKLRHQSGYQFLFMFGILGLAMQFYNFNLQGLLKQYMISDLEINEIQFQLFVSLPGFLSIPLAFIAGVILDKIGFSLGFGIFSTGILIGMWIAVIGSKFLLFGWVLAGKTVAQTFLNLAMGSQGPLISKWYSGGELTQKSGYFEGTIKFSFMVSSFIYPRLAESSDGLFLPILVGALFCTVFYIIGLLAPIIDIKVDNQLKQQLPEDSNSELLNSIQMTQSQQEQQKKCFSLKFLRKFDSHFWILMLAFCTNFFISIIWTSNQSSLITNKFKLSQVNAGDVLSISSLIGLVCPVIGVIMKKVDRQEIFLVFGSCLSIAQYAYIYFHPGCEETCFGQTIPIAIFYGLYLSFFTLILLPAIAMQAPVELIGTAYGIAYGFKNLTEAILPMITAGPLLHAYDPSYTVLFQLIFSILGLLISFWWGYHLRQKRNLNK